MGKCRRAEKGELGGAVETMLLSFSPSLAAPPTPKHTEPGLQISLICIADSSQLLFASVANQRWFK